MNIPAAKLHPWGAPVILGIPLDQNSSYLRGSGEAPPLIRKAFHSDAWNKWTESQVDLGDCRRLSEDAGDLAGNGIARRLFAH